MKEELKEFLIKAKKQTYANDSVEKVNASRLNSIDYEYQENNMLYHDTYFGTTNFIGEEAVYVDNKIIWAMNYYGKTLDESITEEAMDKALRPALMLVGTDETIPVRGPKEFINDEYKYTFAAQGDLSSFDGTEIIYKDNTKVYELKCHGGLVK